MIDRSHVTAGFPHTPVAQLAQGHLGLARALDGLPLEAASVVHLSKRLTHAPEQSLPSLRSVTHFPPVQGRLSKLALIFRSLPLADALRIAAALFFRRGPAGGNAEGDAILRSLLHESRPGFYIEVGGDDPLRHSGTLMLYLQGWCGLNIQRLPRQVARFRRVRRRDVSLCETISDEALAVEFPGFDHPHAHAPSASVDAAQGSGAEPGGSCRMHTRRLDDIVEEHLPAYARISLLSVNMPGHELRVIRSIDLDRQRPAVIVLSQPRPDQTQQLPCPAAEYLQRRDYSQAGEAGGKAYFVDIRWSRWELRDE